MLRRSLPYEHPWEKPERVMTRDEANGGRDLTLRLQAEFDEITPGYEIHEDDLPFIIKSPRPRIHFYKTRATNARMPTRPPILIYILRFAGSKCLDTTAKMPRWLYIHSARHLRRNLSGEAANQG